jgi:hypothetical protein
LYPYNERELGHRYVCREDNIKTQGEGGHVQTKEKDFRRNQPCQHLYPGLLAMPAPLIMSK